MAIIRRFLNKYIIPYFGYLYIWFIGKTSVIKEYNDPGFERLVKNRENFIYAFWHGRMLILCFSHRWQKIHVLISQHRDGELIARIIALLGFGSVRGSSTRGGTKAIFQMADKNLGGYDVAVTPDGPRGPRYEVQPGVIEG